MISPSSPKVKIEAAVSDAMVEQAVATIIEKAKTGQDR